jgi:hypothetical protein
MGPYFSTKSKRTCRLVYCQALSVPEALNYFNSFVSSSVARNKLECSVIEPLNRSQSPVRTIHKAVQLKLDLALARHPKNTCSTAPTEMSTTQPIIDVHTPSTSFAIVHSGISKQPSVETLLTLSTVNQESLQQLYDKLSRKSHTDYHGARVGPGWLKYSWNDTIWSLDDGKYVVPASLRHIQIPRRWRLYDIWLAPQFSAP